ncbi:MAG TPA: MOSC domain-containing protein [Blastocatellia bacterium]|nr:MOSC domain-containing protein [Blastocatellia bacterium]
MKIISLNVGLPREIVYKDRSIVTGIFKEPVEGRIRARRLNLDGDRQADLRVHGGAEKAVYAYPSEHYDYWRAELPDIKLPWGMFGENFTVEGLNEKEVNIGDRFHIGDALFMVTQPRMPCYKLEAKFRRDDMIKRFLRSERSGFYLSVIEEGEVGAGDAIEIVSRDENNITVTNITQLYVSKGKDQDLLRRAAVLEALPASWRDYFLDRIEEH